MSIAPTGLSRIFRDPAPDPNLSETPTVTLDGPALSAIFRIVELQLRQVPLDALTAEVLPAMLALFDAPAGALLLYRREDATLTLAAARGLAVAGAEALDVLRWGDERGSEMPLRALLDRKIYVVDHPDNDAFTRTLTGPDKHRTPSSVAAVPLYRWQLPVGVLLILGGQRSLSAEELLTPTFTYSVLGLALSTMLWACDDRGAIPLPASDVAPPPLICVPWITHHREPNDEISRPEAAHDAGIAAARQEHQQALEAGIATLRAEGRAVLEASITAAREESRGALDMMLQELRAAVSGMEAERQATAQERTALGERLVTFEQGQLRLAERLAAAEDDRHRFTSRLDSLENVLTLRLEAAVSAAQTPASGATTAGASITSVAAPPATPPSSLAAPFAPPDSHTTDPELSAASASAPAAARNDTAQDQRLVLESDAPLRDHIQTALATAIPAGRGNLVAVNLIGCDAARLTEMATAMDAGTLLVGYASDPSRGSRILGPLRCFAAPPTAAETTAAAESATRGNRRTILLSEDIDAFMVAKTALTKAGHSVSMACDEKQALDLLAILRPDTVMVDVRGAGQPTVDFLDALGPESGRILTLLIHGDSTGATLSRLAERMLRPTGLDVNELAKVCRNALPEVGKRPSVPRPTR